MPERVVLKGDRIVGQCPNHMIPNPNSGAPQPAPPMSFSAPLVHDLTTNVKIDGKPVAVVGSWGVNTPPHVGLHPSDPFVVAASQRGIIIEGDPSIMIEGKPIAKTGSPCMCCAVPGELVGTGSVFIS